ncbi:MAG: hypothetical protein AB1489_15985 [Acidobacteriota bacterium]
MKKCPFCARSLQNDAHHCHHCNSMILDMDGNPISPQGKRFGGTEERQLEWLEKVIRVLVMIFFTVQFFIIGMTLLELFFGITIIQIDSALGLTANIILLLMSMAGSIFISPIVINWVKNNFDRVMK